MRAELKALRIRGARILHMRLTWPWFTRWPVAWLVASVAICGLIVRADSAGPHTIAASERKAFTSASAKSATTSMMETAQKNPGAANLVHIPGFLLLGGGMPVKVGNEVIGAVGVGGAPGGHLDDQCVAAALESVKEQLK